MLTVVREAAEKVGGVAELARRLGLTRSAIYQWTEVPVERASDLERISGISRSRIRPDLFRSTVAPALDNTEYDYDYFAWLMHQAELLSEKRLDALDLVHLIDEIRDLARAEKRQIESRLGVLLIHLLKWAHQPEKRSGSWASAMIEQRARILKRLQESPSLRGYPAEVLDEEYATAVGRAAAEAGLARETFPSECPFTIEQVLDPDFLP
jgi:DNA-binding transcriptional regulator YdaS (Cro superfamily)